MMEPLSPSRAAATLSRAYYGATLEEFRAAPDETVLAKLVRANAFELGLAQRDAWREQLVIMRRAVSDLPGNAWLALEFAVPRMGKRIDVLLTLPSAVCVLEFKVGDREFAPEAMRQVWDYALDLKNFHSTSHNATIVPILVATAAPGVPPLPPSTRDPDGVMRPLCATPATLPGLLAGLSTQAVGAPIDILGWRSGAYRPTPTIIEAARALYAGHGVEDISRREADAINLSETASVIDRAIADAKRSRKKIICFVTGVPGAGKTLVGLDVATKHNDRASDLHSVFLSGNGPLVRILCEALARDRVERSVAEDRRVPIGVARSQVKAFIQNVHHFRDECLRDGTKPPVEHVALFDEAQRAWNREQTASFMSRKKGVTGFAMSEPAFLVSCMDRHEDWAVIVCLVGGGQEINTGEAGIGEWLRAIRAEFPHWHVWLSPHLKDSEYAAGAALSILQGHEHVQTHASLHLGVSMRSFRAEHVSGWVKAVLDKDREAAVRTLEGFSARYPVVLTRDLGRAREWVRAQARGNERFGMVVSSQAQRLRPLAIDVRVGVDPVHWFLHPREDVRSSLYLEDAATEFDVQGLELDWVCVVWDADLRFAGGAWEHWAFKGSRWQRIRQDARKAYLKNAYRVLLTRARQGMAIVVPEGDPMDPTRLPEVYTGTFDYLHALGLPRLA